MCIYKYILKLPAPPVSDALFCTSGGCVVVYVEADNVERKLGEDYLYGPLDFEVFCLFEKHQLIKDYVWRATKRRLFV